MAITYQLRNNTYDGVTYQDILLKEDGVVKTAIPKATDNKDYQEYLEWAKTNTAEAAD